MTHDTQSTIAQLFIHPIKSCAGISVQAALLTHTGLQYDRQWMLIDGNQRFLSQRELAHMVLIEPNIVGDCLHINAPNMLQLSLPIAQKGEELQVQIWDDVVSAFDCGNDAAAWFTQALGQSVRLVQFNPAKPRACSTTWTNGAPAVTQFSDGYPILVTTVAAVDELNQRLSHNGFAPIDQRRFRPNVVLADLNAHDEDLLDVLHISADAPIALKIAKPCERCPIPSINPDTAQAQPEAVSDTILTYRADARLDGAITFGMNAIVLAGAGQILRVGQSVAADYGF